MRTDFRTTHWSVVLAAADEGAGASVEALERLCHAYWYPLYAHVRRRGFDAHASQDLTQSFFEQLLEKQFLRLLHPARGKFRSFLLACLGHFLANEWRNGHALKRGGTTTLVPLDLVLAENRFAADVAASLPSELAYDREWAMSVLDQAMGRLEREAAESGKAQLFTSLKPFLVAPTPDGGYESMAPGLGMTPHAVGMAVFRLRQRFRDVVREAVAQTVTTPLELEEELRHLRNILSQ
jgi:DNA-directed RNA polymerase specialized sigma24 family protein